MDNTVIKNQYLWALIIYQSLYVVFKYKFALLLITSGAVCLFRCCLPNRDNVYRQKCHPDADAKIWGFHNFNTVTNDRDDCDGDGDGDGDGEDDEEND